MRSSFVSSLFVALVALVASTSLTDAKKVIVNQVKVDVSSITLADDCRPAPARKPTKFAKPPPATAQRSEADVPDSGAPVQGSCAPGANCNFRSRPVCVQSSMQLSIAASSMHSTTTIVVRKVELLNAKGKVIEVLRASGATRWDDATSAYVAWNGRVDADGTLQVSYHLSAPSWDKHSGGRLGASGKTFQVRLTVSVGGADRTIEQTATVPAFIEPNVVT